ncbi:hypothetical protein FNV43_RR00211 [Rhamnella rubrinervis]|uniref:Leucine-rich repeat-containing N-terminal plant-type domain-containing protein n=1 Tax=Rhamnella rubrinervis TaxID=2594499 RepID=A0A8K0HQ59_9ROSA|nr:hypothetical protein FNV43_RR00211 [Rhamnella rubrinervis]
MTKYFVNFVAESALSLMTKCHSNVSTTAITSSSLITSCLPDQTAALLQFKGEFAFIKPNFGSYYFNCPRSADLYYHADDYESYPKMKFWEKEKDCCSWDGVACNTETGKVVGLTIFISIVLSNNRFDGDIPSSIGKLQSLIMLNLSSSNFTGTIPSYFGYLRELESLDLSKNKPLVESLNSWQTSHFQDYVALKCQRNVKIRTHDSFPSKDEEESENGFTWKVVVMGYGCGFVVGLVIGHLTFVNKDEKLKNMDEKVLPASESPIRSFQAKALLVVFYLVVFLFRSLLVKLLINLMKCGPMVLDALIKIKNEMDSKLMFRHSCWEGIYGSCAMNIDGCNGLTCLTKIESGTNTTITLLPHMFVIKNLGVDMTNFYNQYKSKEPWLKRKNPPHVPGKEILQSKKDMAKLDGMYECILSAATLPRPIHVGTPSLIWDCRFAPR